MPSPIKFTPETTLFLQRAETFRGRHLLREDHFQRLSRNGRGYLRDQTIAMANLYTCIDESKLLTIYTDGKFEAQEDPRHRSFAEDMARTGCLVIPFPQPGETLDELGARNWQRVRTDFTPKYLSPLGAHNPPYMPLGYFFPPFIGWMKGQIIDAVFERTGTAKTPDSLRIAEEALQWSGYNELYKGLENPKLDVIVVEGEFKALSIYDAWIDLHESILTGIFQSEDPQEYPYYDLTPPPLAVCLGIVGVWGMLRKNKTAASGYELRPEWASALGTAARRVKICFDSDSEWNINIGHAASQMSQTLREYNMTTEYISIPSPPQHKLGADDYLVEQAAFYRGEGASEGFHEASQDFYNLVQSAEPIAGGVSYNELVRVTKPSVDQATGEEIKPPSAIGYLKQRHRQSQV